MEIDSYGKYSADVIVTFTFPLVLACFVMTIGFYFLSEKYQCSLRFNRKKYDCITCNEYAPVELNGGVVFFSPHPRIIFP